MSRSIAEGVVSAWAHRTRAERRSPWLSVTCTIKPYVVVGTSPDQLWEAAALLGPSRHGQRHRAYTDWHIRYAFVPLRILTGFRAGAVRVRGQIDLAWPAWQAPRGTSLEMTARCHAMLDAIRVHEQHHQQSGVATCEALVETIYAVRPHTTAASLHEAVDRAATTLMAEARARDELYDETCEREGPAWRST